MQAQRSSPSTLPGNPQDSINLIAQDMKLLVKKIQDLRHLGIEDNRIALPKICVVGDQSTGKSLVVLLSTLSQRSGFISRRTSRQRWSRLLSPIESTSVAMGREADDSDCEMTIVQPSIKRDASGAQTAGPQTPDEIPARKVTGYSTTHFDYFDRPARMFTWEQIKEINEDSYRAGIPDQTDPKAIEIMN